MVAATSLAAFFVYEFKHWGLGFGLIYMAIIGYMRLALGLNTLNQILFGTTIGIWLSCFVFHIINFNNNQTFHFQLVTRGRIISNGLD